MDELPQKLPTHVAVTMDGNGRWARAGGLSRNKGHRAGAKSAGTIAKCCVEFGIPYLTLFTFSTENWRRPALEVRFLMGLLRTSFNQGREELLESDIRLLGIGRRDELPPALRRELERTEEATRHCSALTLLLAINYGARSEIVDACRSLARQVEAGRLSPGQIEERHIREHLYTAGIPDPDLLIRTGGEMRLSNFLLWQISYAELYITEILWPDFRREQFIEALREFARRERRFGGISGAVRPAGRSAAERPKADRA